MKLLKLQILALILTATGFAQTAQTAPAAPTTPPVQSESLLIGPGDMLHVSVFDTPEMDQHARVTDDGNVPLIFLGNVHVAGLTPEQAATPGRNSAGIERLHEAPAGDGVHRPVWNPGSAGDGPGEEPRFVSDRHRAPGAGCIELSWGP